MGRISSLKRLSAIKIAVILCTNSDFKIQLLRVSGVESNLKNFCSGNISVYHGSWLKKIELQFKLRMKTFVLLPLFVNKIVYCLKSIAMELLGWCQYHREVFDLPPSFSIQLLDSNVFTGQGRVDRRKAAERLVSSTNLSVIRRYRVACSYLLTNELCDIWRNQMSDKERGLFYHIWGPKHVYQPKMAILWSYCLMGKGDEILENYGRSRGNHPIFRQDTFWQCAFEQSVEDANVVGMKFSWQMLLAETRQRLGVQTIIELLRLLRLEYYDPELYVSFGNHIDMFCFLLSTTQVDKSEVLLRKDIHTTGHSEVLTYLMEWQDEDMFLEVLKVTSTFLSPEIVVKTLLHFKGFPNWNNLKFFKQFWKQLPVNVKHYALSNNDFLEHVKTFDEDMEIIKFIIKHLPDEEKANVIFPSKDMQRKGLLLIEFFNDNHDVCKWLIQHMKSFDFDKKMQLKNVLHYLAFNFRFITKRDIAVIFELGQLCLEVDEFHTLKSNFDSGLGKELCNILWKDGCCQQVENYLLWCCSLYETTHNFKETFLREYGAFIFYTLLIENKSDTIRKLSSWCEIPEDFLKEIKKQVLLKYLKDRNMPEDCLYETSSELKTSGNNSKTASSLLKWCCSDSVNIVLDINN